jgi:hypothetical protein
MYSNNYINLRKNNELNNSFLSTVSSQAMEERMFTCNTCGIKNPYILIKGNIVIDNYIKVDKQLYCMYDKNTGKNNCLTKCIICSKLKKKDEYAYHKSCMNKGLDYIKTHYKNAPTKNEILKRLRTCPICVYENLQEHYYMEDVELYEIGVSLPYCKLHIENIDMYCLCKCDSNQKEHFRRKVQGYNLCRYCLNKCKKCEEILEDQEKIIFLCECHVSLKCSECNDIGTFNNKVNSKWKCIEHVERCLMCKEIIKNEIYTDNFSYCDKCINEKKCKCGEKYLTDKRYDFIQEDKCYKCYHVRFCRLCKNSFYTTFKGVRAYCNACDKK